MQLTRALSAFVVLMTTLTVIAVPLFGNQNFQNRWSQLGQRFNQFRDACKDKCSAPYNIGSTTSPPFPGKSRWTWQSRQQNSPDRPPFWRNPDRKFDSKMQGMIQRFKTQNQRNEASVNAQMDKINRDNARINKAMAPHDDDVTVDDWKKYGFTDEDLQHLNWNNKKPPPYRGRRYDISVEDELRQLEQEVARERQSSSKIHSVA